MLTQRPVRKSSIGSGRPTRSFNALTGLVHGAGALSRPVRVASARDWVAAMALAVPMMMGAQAQAAETPMLLAYAPAQQSWSALEAPVAAGTLAAAADAGQSAGMMLTALSRHAPYAASGSKVAAAAAPAPQAAAGTTPARADAKRAAARRAEARDLAAEQRNIARFVADKYRISYKDVHRFVTLAYDAAREFKLDPHLVLAVVSIESNFNPKAQSNKGAQGLMQVLTRVHPEKFKSFGGPKAAFDPVANLHVGSRILKEYLQRAGTVEGALKSYVGAALLRHDYGYGRKVLGERARIASAASGAERAPMLAQQTRPEVVKLAAADLTKTFADRGRTSVRERTATRGQQASRQARAARTQQVARSDVNGASQTMLD